MDLPISFRLSLRIFVFFSHQTDLGQIHKDGLGPAVFAPNPLLVWLQVTLTLLFQCALTVLSFATKSFLFSKTHGVYQPSDSLCHIFYYEVWALEEGGLLMTNVSRYCIFGGRGSFVPHCHGSPYRRFYPADDLVPTEVVSTVSTSAA